MSSRREPASDVFCFIGADARTQWLPPEIVRDELGYVCTGRDVMDLVARAQGRWPLARDPFLLEASVPGVFVAGDVRHGSVKRVASGVGEGSMAIAFIHQYLAGLAPCARRRLDAVTPPAAPPQARATPAPRRPRAGRFPPRRPDSPATHRRVLAGEVDVARALALDAVERARIGRA